MQVSSLIFEIMLSISKLPLAIHGPKSMPLASVSEPFRPTFHIMQRQKPITQRPRRPNVPLRGLCHSF